MTNNEYNVDYYSGPEKYYDSNARIDVVKIHSGHWYASDKRELLVTVLGSCVSCCLWDSQIKAGGINHFLLPGDADSGTTARFGVNAMELLINGMIKKGAVKSRMVAKVFGGASLLMGSTAQIGNRNIQFVHEFLLKEEIKIASEDVGGNSSRRIHFYPETGKVMLRKLIHSDNLNIIKEETKYMDRFREQLQKAEDVTLF